MIAQTSVKTSLIAVALAVASGMLTTLPTGALAAQQLVPVEGADYNVGASLTDNLKAFIGKKVYLTLDSGSIFAGSVKAVGDHLIHLEKLEGKEYFDALVRIDSISAIDTRFRQFQR